MLLFHADNFLIYISRSSVAAKHLAYSYQATDLTYQLLALVAWNSKLVQSHLKLLATQYGFTLHAQLESKYRHAQRPNLGITD